MFVKLCYECFLASYVCCQYFLDISVIVYQNHCGLNLSCLLCTQEKEFEEPIDEEEQKAEAKTDESTTEEDEDGAVEEEEEESDKPKTKKVRKTVWDWELMNSVKPIWTRK